MEKPVFGQRSTPEELKLAAAQREEGDRLARVAAQELAEKMRIDEIKDLESERESLRLFDPRGSFGRRPGLSEEENRKQGREATQARIEEINAKLTELTS